MMKRFSAAMRKYRDDIKGAMVIYFVIIFTTMIALAGVAIDIARYEADRSQVQAHLDNATLAAASLRQSVSNPPEEIVAEYMQKAGMSDHFVVTTDLEKTINSITYRRVEAYATADVATMFMDMFGVDKLGIRVDSVAEERIPHVEISLILDVSGSMAGDKIDALKLGANSFIDSVLAANTESDPYRISVSLVPYNMQVNGGEALWNAFGGPVVHDHAYCAEWTSSAFSTLDFSPLSVEQAMPMQYTLKDSWDYFSEDWWENVSSSQHVYSRKGKYGSSWDYTYSYLPTGMEGDNWYCRDEQWAQILPMSADADELKSRINSFEARGNTSIDIAMKWGAALLNPDHRDEIQDLIDLWQTDEDGDGIVDGTIDTVFGSPEAEEQSSPQAIDPGFTGRPVDFGSDTTMKVVVLMTDGQNTTEYRVKSSYRSGNSPRSERVGGGNLDGILDIYNNRSGSDWNRLTWAEYWERVPVYTHYKRVGGGGWSTYWNYNLGNSAKNTRLSSICDKIKDPDADGDEEVVVFTIAYSAPSDGRTAMKNCATTENSPHYFSADTDTIEDVFKQIGGVIEKLKLVE